jgi:hypothetical protein
MPPEGGIRLPGAHIDEATGVHPGVHRFQKGLRAGTLARKMEEWQSLALLPVFALGICLATGMLPEAQTEL